MLNELEPIAIPTITPFEFQFATSAATKSATRLYTERNNLAAEISGVMDEAERRLELHSNVLGQVISMMHKKDGTVDAEKIVILGQVLTHLGRKMAKFEELNKAVQFIDFALQKPHFVADVFGSFDSDLSDFLSSFETDPAKE